VANHQKRTLGTQFAKAYRTLSQAVNLAIAEHGGIETWAWKDSWAEGEKDKFVKNYFLPYMNVIKYCSGKTNKECFGGDINYSWLNNSPWTLEDINTDPKVMLADGVSIDFYFPGSCFTTKNKCMDFIIDINGSKNKPNRAGKDTFLFSLYPQTGEFLPLGVNADKTYDEEAKTFTKKTLVEVSEECARSGCWCAAKIINDGFKINYNW